MRVVTGEVGVDMGGVKVIRDGEVTVVVDPGLTARERTQVICDLLTDEEYDAYLTANARSGTG